MSKGDVRNEYGQYTQHIEEDEDIEHDFYNYAQPSNNTTTHNDYDTSSSEDEVIVEPGYTDEEEEDDDYIEYNTPDDNTKRTNQSLNNSSKQIKFLWSNDPITLRLDDKTTPSPMFNNLSLRLSQQRSTCAAVATSSSNNNSNGGNTSANTSSNSNTQGGNEEDSYRPRRNRPPTKSTALFDVPILSFVNTSCVCTIMPSPEDKVQHRQPRVPHGALMDGDSDITVPVSATPSILSISSKTQQPQMQLQSPPQPIAQLQSPPQSLHSQKNSFDKNSPGSDFNLRENPDESSASPDPRGTIISASSRNGSVPIEQEVEYALSNITKGLTFQGEALYVSKWLNLGPSLGQVIIVGSHRTIRVCRIHETTSEFTSTILHESDISTIAAPAIPHAAPFACAACAVSGTRGCESSLVLVATNIGVIRTFEISRSKKSDLTTVTTSTSSSSSSSTSSSSDITVVEKDIHTHMKSILCMASAGCGGLSITVAGADEVGATGADWACANDVGIIAVWGRNSAGGWARVAAFAPPSQDPCTSLAFHPTCPAIIAAYASGHLRVYSLESHALALEIAAHARPIMGMDTIACLGRPIVVTAAEDTWIRGWSLPPKLIMHSVPGSDGMSDEEGGKYARRGRGRGGMVGGCGCRGRKGKDGEQKGKDGGGFVTYQEELILSYPEDRVTQIFSTKGKAKMWTGVQLLEQQPVPMLAAVAYDDPHLYLYIPQ